MQQRQRDVAALDARYTKELADARAENETLRADVAAGRKRLRVNATRPGTVREATGTSSVDNATGPRLADTAERDYFILRERLMTMQKQLEGAQEYIRTQCTVGFYYPRIHEEITGNRRTFSGNNSVPYFCSVVVFLLKVRSVVNVRNYTPDLSGECHE